MIVGSEDVEPELEPDDPLLPPEDDDALGVGRGVGVGGAFVVVNDK